MSLNVPDKDATAQKRKAAELLALDELSDQQIADAVGVTKRTITRWKHLPLVKQIIAEATKEIGEAIRAEGIREKQFRLAAQEERWRDLEALRKARGADPHISSFPGGATGFVAVDLKQVKHLAEPKEGEDGVPQWTQEYWTHAFDATLWNAYLSIERHIAQEMGQWTDKAELDMTSVVEFVGFDPEKL